LKYTARRLDFFWTNLNNLCCIVFAIFISLIITKLSGGFKGDFEFWKFLSILPFVFYGFAGLFIAFRDINDSNEFEKIFLVNYKKLSKIKNAIDSEKS